MKALGDYKGISVSDHSSFQLSFSFLSLLSVSNMASFRSSVFTYGKSIPAIASEFGRTVEEVSTGIRVDLLDITKALTSLDWKVYDLYMYKNLSASEIARRLKTGEEAIRHVFQTLERREDDVKIKQEPNMCIVDLPVSALPPVVPDAASEDEWIESDSDSDNDSDSSWHPSDADDESSESEYEADSETESIASDSSYEYESETEEEKPVKPKRRLRRLGGDVGYDTETEFQPGPYKPRVKAVVISDSESDSDSDSESSASSASSDSSASSSTSSNDATHQMKIYLSFNDIDEIITIQKNPTTFMYGILLESQADQYQTMEFSESKVKRYIKDILKTLALDSEPQDVEFAIPFLPRLSQSQADILRNEQYILNLIWDYFIYAN